VIFVSTVRTADEKFDPLMENSFFASRKHINVAISRAQDYLVIVGDPALWAKNSDWGHIFEHARTVQGRVDDRTGTRFA